jgi:queuine tRNA-ribosyltransferase
MGRIVQVSSGEVMHPVADPREEARQLYVEGSGLKRWLEGHASSDAEARVTIWDVGMGAATNAMAAIEAFEAIQTPQAGNLKMRIVSFERDLDPMRLVTDHPHSFPHVKHRAPHLLLEKGHYESPDGRLEWKLVQGDFEVSAFEEKSLPDFVFYDPFSSKTDSQLWEWRFFERLLKHWGEHRVRVANYSNSTAHRASALAAGFWIASGPPSARRPDTSIWYSPSAASEHSGAPFLKRDWLDRWSRSSAPAPQRLIEAAGNELEEFSRRVRNHRQFS